MSMGALLVVMAAVEGECVMLWGVVVEVAWPAG